VEWLLLVLNVGDEEGVPRGTPINVRNSRTIFCVQSNGYRLFGQSEKSYRGKPFTTRRKFLKGLCKRAGIRPFEFHALRRYVASVLADTHKVSAKTIQRVLRHKNVMTTERHIQNINQDLAGTINLLSGKGPHEGSPKEIEK